MRAERRGRAEWQRLIAELEESGLSHEDFAAGLGVSVSTLRWWRSRLKRAAGPREGAVGLLPFVRVRVSREEAGRKAVASDGPSGPTVEMPYGLVLRLPGGSTAEYVSAVLAGTLLRLRVGSGRC